VARHNKYSMSAISSYLFRIYIKINNRWNITKNMCHTTHFALVYVFLCNFYVVTNNPASWEDDIPIDRCYNVAIATKSLLADIGNPVKSIHCMMCLV
jgi:hypothetical protein